MVELKSYDKQQIYKPNERYLTIPEINFDAEEAIITKFKVASFANALLTPTHHVFFKGKYVPTGLYTTEDNKSLSLKQRLYFYLKFGFLTPVIKLQGTYFLAHDAWSDNYYHWLCEVMPRLFLMREQYKDGMVLLPKALSQFAFIVDSLEIESIKVQWIETGKSYRLGNLVTVLTTPAWGNVIPQVQIQLISSLLNNLNIKSRATANKKIFVSRAKARRRLIENEQAILDLMVANGYEIIHPENLTFKQQVEVFSKSVSLVSLHGAGLTNLMFMPEGSKVLEIREKNWATNPLCYWRLANVLNIKWSYHFGEAVGELSNFNNIAIDFESFKRDFTEFERN